MSANDAAPTPASTNDATVTDAELAWALRFDTGERTYMERLLFKLATALRAERIDRDNSARAIVDFAKHCERSSILDEHHTAIDTAMERLESMRLDKGQLSWIEIERCEDGDVSVTIHDHNIFDETMIRDEIEQASVSVDYSPSEAVGIANAMLEAAGSPDLRAQLEEANERLIADLITERDVANAKLIDANQRLAQYRNAETGDYHAIIGREIWDASNQAMKTLTEAFGTVNAKLARYEESAKSATVEGVMREARQMGLKMYGSDSDDAGQLEEAHLVSTITALVAEKVKATERAERYEAVVAAARNFVFDDMHHPNHHQAALKHALDALDNGGTDGR